MVKECLVRVLTAATLSPLILSTLIAVQTNAVVVKSLKMFPSADTNTISIAVYSSPCTVTAVMAGDVTAVMAGDVTAVMAGDVTAVIAGDVTAVMAGDVTAVMAGDVTAVMAGDVTAVDGILYSCHLTLPCFIIINITTSHQIPLYLFVSLEH
jgi:acetyl/propionyl-CoA carboxylase alpha subunit